MTGRAFPKIIKEDLINFRYLPIANISRIMKKALPENAKIAKDAKETVQECVSEFISFITSEYPFEFLLYTIFFIYNPLTTYGLRKMQKREKENNKWR